MPKPFEEDEHDRRETVCVRDDVVNRAFVLIAVHTHDAGDVITLRRSGGDNFLRARLEMCPGLRGVGEEAR